MRFFTSCLIVGFLFGSLTAADYSSLSDKDLDLRATAIEKHFQHEKTFDSPWFWGWVGFTSAVMTASISLNYALEKGTPNQRVQVIGIGVASIAITSYLLAVPVSLYAGDDLKEMPTLSREEKIKKLKRSEQLLNRARIIQQLTTNWWAHLGTFLVTLSSGLVEAIYFERVGFGVARFVVSMAVGEYKIYTESKRSIRFSADYNAKYYANTSQVKNNYGVIAFTGNGLVGKLRF